MSKLKRLFMILDRYFSCDSSMSFWHLPVSYEENFSLQNPLYYPMDFTNKTKYNINLDNNGVPVLDYKGYIGVRYNPCAVAQYTLGYLSLYAKDRNIITRDKVINLCNWLVDNLKKSDKENDMYSWYYDFDLDAYNIKAPWNSAIAQGQGISVLVRAYSIFGNEAYKEAAVKAFTPFTKYVEEGGLKRLIDNKYICFEEVPTNEISCILDGFMYALIGLKDMSVFLNLKEAEILWDEGLECLEYILPRFDIGYWSKGDIYPSNFPMLASFFYHNIHINQLKYFYKITGKSIFKFYLEKWEIYAKNRTCCVRAYIHKVLFKLFYY